MGARGGWARLHVLIAFILAHAVVAAKLAVGGLLLHVAFCEKQAGRIDRAAEAFHQATNHDPTVSSSSPPPSSAPSAALSACVGRDGATLAKRVGRGMERVLRIVCQKEATVSTKIGIGITTASSDANTTAQIHMVENRVAPRLLILMVGSGLSNRLRAIVSARLLARRAGRTLVVLWPRDAHCRAPMRTLLRASTRLVPFGDENDDNREDDSSMIFEEGGSKEESDMFVVDFELTYLRASSTSSLSARRPATEITRQPQITSWQHHVLLRQPRARPRRRRKKRRARTTTTRKWPTEDTGATEASAAAPLRAVEILARVSKSRRHTRWFPYLLRRRRKWRR